MPLTDAKLRNLKTPGRYFDGGGLYLEVTASATATTGRYWRLKYRHGGKERLLAFGVYPEVSLKDARERREAARAHLALGVDPMQAQREAQLQAEREAEMTLEGVAGDWLEHQKERWSAGTLAMIRRVLEVEVFSQLGQRPLAQIRPAEIMKIVKGIEARGAGETAGRVLQRVKAIYRYALVHGLIESNPMVDLKPSELLKPRQVRHRAALADKELPAFLAALGAYRGEASVKAALRLLMLTAVRPGELRGARWSEFDVDVDQAMWRIPGERMKMKAPHLVPLSRQAVELLEGQRKLTGAGELVFPSPFYPGKQLSENTLNSALARMGYKGEHSAHGFRALFSTIANEHGHDEDAIERQLAHSERNEVRAAYHRAEYLSDRRTLLQWWADYLDARA
ncbi:MAG: tyrosine-type recombinase/integrase [Proteobacteria bacterium]|nr:tyrosine-type recombinase/integrase [Pseudomonadota bacterium]